MRKSRDILGIGSFLHSFWIMISAILLDTSSFSKSNRLERLLEIVFHGNAATSVEGNTVSFFQVFDEKQNTTFQGTKYNFSVSHISVFRTH